MIENKQQWLKNALDWLDEKTHEIKDEVEDVHDFPFISFRNTISDIKTKYRRINMLYSQIQKAEHDIYTLLVECNDMCEVDELIDEWETRDKGGV